MFKLLFKYLLPLAAVMVTGLVGYNYFYGTPEEKQQSEQIISKVRGLGTEVVNLLFSEKEKFDSGKYNGALDKIGSGLDSLKDAASSALDGGQEWLNRIQELEGDKRALEDTLEEYNRQFPDGISPEAPPTARGFGDLPSDPNGVQTIIQQLEAQIKSLAEQTETLGSEIEHGQ